MRKTVLALLAAIPVALVASQARADDPQGPGPRGGPGMLFQRLDRNKDGKVTADEVPETAPEFVKDVLRKADKDQDKTITAEELRNAASHARPDSPNAHFRGPRPEAGPPRHGRPGPPIVGRGPRPDGRPEVGPAGRPDMDPKAVFAKLDRDKDGKLSPEEFAAGMKALHAGMHGPGRPEMGPPAGPGPKPEARRSARSHSPARHRGAMRHFRGHAPTGSPYARFRGTPRAPMAWHGRFHGMKRPPMGPHARFHSAPRGPMGPRPGFGGMHRPSAPWQARFHGMLGARVGAHGGPFPGMLKDADKNDDGKISKAEAPERLKQNFERVDANKDGQLDRVELAKGGAAIRAKFRAGVVDKRREAMAKRIQAVRKAHEHAGRPQPKKPVAKKPEVKKPEAKKPAAEKKTAEKKPKAEKKDADKKPAAKKPEN
jgi:Ca2+-binding EF-hand superfamily protein